MNIAQNYDEELFAEYDFTVKAIFDSQNSKYLWSIYENSICAYFHQFRICLDLLFEERVNILGVNELRIRDGEGLTLFIC